MFWTPLMLKSPSLRKPRRRRLNRYIFIQHTDLLYSISAIRRESLGPGVVASTNLEHKVWQDVTRRLSTIGMKRQRRKSSVVDAADDEDGGRPRKRRARKSFSGLTKAEVMFIILALSGWLKLMVLQLESELRAALRRLEETEETEPLDEDTAEVLRDELNLREREVAELRDEILRLKVQRPHEESVVETPTRLLTPPQFVSFISYNVLL